MLNREPVAHVSEDGSRFHVLYDHLKRTAEKADEFYAEFACGEWLTGIECIKSCSNTGVCTDVC